MSEIRKRDAFTRRTAVRINIPSFKVARYPRLSHLHVFSILDLRRCKSASLWLSSMARYSWHNSIIICEWKIRTQYGELRGYRICISTKEIFFGTMTWKRHFILNITNGNNFGCRSLLIYSPHFIFININFNINFININYFY